MDFTRQSTLRVELFVSACALGLVGVTICYAASPGLNWGIWTSIAAGELAMFAGPRVGVNRRALYVTLGAAVLLAAGDAVTTNNVANALIFLTVMTLLVVAARLAAGFPAPLLGAAELARTPFVATFAAVHETGAQVTAAVHAAFTPSGARVVRGTAITVPVVVIFTALLSGADPTLASWMHALSMALSDWSWIPRTMLFAVIGTLALGSFGLAALPLGSHESARSDAPMVLGDTERRIVVGAVDALFGLFLLLQVLSHLPAGQSYTAYVHRGFAQLTLVATLSVILVARLHHGRPRVAIPWGTLALLAEVELLVASALHRITVYQQTFGYTALRVWVTAYMLLIAGLLVLLAIEVAQPRIVDANRFVRRAALLAVATLTVLVYGNPDAWTAEAEFARYRATGKLDVSSFTGLSPDATPSVLRIADALPRACGDTLRASMQRATPRHHWYEWNARMARAERAQKTLPALAADPRSCGIQPW